MASLSTRVLLHPSNNIINYSITLNASGNAHGSNMSLINENNVTKTDTNTNTNTSTTSNSSGNGVLSKITNFFNNNLIGF